LNLWSISLWPDKAGLLLESILGEKGQEETVMIVVPLRPVPATVAVTSSSPKFEVV
jgi:hypothetical protein